MYGEEMLEVSREEAKKARERLNKIEEQPTGITGGDGAASHAAVTRTAMRKNTDNILKETRIRPVLDYLKENGLDMNGVIPHPLAWDVMDDGDGTYYLHTIDGTDIECAYSRSGGDITFHRLTADGKTFIETDTAVKAGGKDRTRAFFVGLAILVAIIAVGMLLLTWSY